MWKNSYGSHAACIDRKYKEDRWGNVREDALSEAMKKKYALSDDKIETLPDSFIY